MGPTHYIIVMLISYLVSILTFSENIYIKTQTFQYFSKKNYKLKIIFMIAEQVQKRLREVDYSLLLASWQL
jgi:hypothetical protein